MEFLFGQTLTRERRTPVADPYDPALMVPGSWFDPVDTLTLEGAFINSVSSVAPVDATRVQRVSTKSLYLTDPTLDVVAGDRITGDGAAIYYVNEIPSADTSPFTGWQPVVRIPLDLTEG